ncbi:PF07600 domain protein, partial [Leptospira kirschneri str. 200803703]|uniref:DUF1564 family protein n=1 Tax=Leptospira kirschneri TaxID=29507 RepID=UPI0002BE74DE
MDILLLDDGQKIESALVEDSFGTDSLLVPDVYWNRLNFQERKALRGKLPFLLRKYSKQIASMKRLHDRAGKIKYNRCVGKMKKFSIRVHTITLPTSQALVSNLNINPISTALIRPLKITSGPGGASDLRAKWPPNLAIQLKTVSKSGSLLGGFGVSKIR